MTPVIPADTAAASHGEPLENRQQPVHPAGRSVFNLDESGAVKPQIPESLPRTTLSSSFDEVQPAAKRRKLEGTPKNEGEPVERRRHTTGPRASIASATGISPVSSFASKRPRNADGTFVKLKGAAAKGEGFETGGSPQVARPKKSRSRAKEGSQQRRRSLPDIRPGQGKSGEKATQITSKKGQSTTIDSTSSKKLPVAKKPRRNRQSMPARIVANSQASGELGQIATPQTETPASSRSERKPRATGQTTSRVLKQNRAEPSSSSSASMSRPGEGRADNNSLATSHPVTPHDQGPATTTIHRDGKSSKRRQTTATSRSEAKRSRQSNSLAPAVNGIPTSSSSSGFSHQHPPSTIAQRSTHSASRRQKRRAASSIETPHLTASFEPPNTMSSDLLALGIPPVDRASQQPGLWEGLLSARDSPMYDAHRDMSASGSDADDMGGTSFGHDGAVDMTASSPGSVATTATRTSSRIRKPTVRALESMHSKQAQAQAARRKRTPSQVPRSVNGDAIDGKTVSPDNNALAAVSVSTQSSTSAASTEATDVTIPRSDLKLVGARNVNLGSVKALGRRLCRIATSIIVNDTDDKCQSDANLLAELRAQFEAQCEAQQAAATDTADAVTDEYVAVDGNAQSMPDAGKPFFHTYPVIGARWTDKDGWLFTGQANDHGDEIILVPENTFGVYRANNTYTDGEVPEPPVRIRSHDQAHKDDTYGYPPLFGERNVPPTAENAFQGEDVAAEKERIRLRNFVIARGVKEVDRYSVGELRKMVDFYEQTDANHRRLKEEGVTEESGFVETTTRGRSTRASRAATHSAVSDHAQLVGLPESGPSTPHLQSKDAEETVAAESTYEQFQDAVKSGTSKTNGVPATKTPKTKATSKGKTAVNQVAAGPATAQQTDADANSVGTKSVSAANANTADTNSAPTNANKATKRKRATPLTKSNVNGVASAQDTGAEDEATETKVTKKIKSMSAKNNSKATSNKNSKVGTDNTENQVNTGGNAVQETAKPMTTATQPAKSATPAAKPANVTETGTLVGASTGKSANSRKAGRNDAIATAATTNNRRRVRVQTDEVKKESAGSTAAEQSPGSAGPPAPAAAAATAADSQQAGASTTSSKKRRRIDTTTSAAADEPAQVRDHVTGDLQPNHITNNTNTNGRDPTKRRGLVPQQVAEETSTSITTANATATATPTANPANIEPTNAEPSGISKPKKPRKRRLEETMPVTTMTGTEPEMETEPETASAGAGTVGSARAGAASDPEAPEPEFPSKKAHFSAELLSAAPLPLPPPPPPPVEERKKITIKLRVPQ